MPANTAPQREPLLLNLGLNIVAPSLVLTKLSAPDALGPVAALLVALAFPWATAPGTSSAAASTTCFPCSAWPASP